VVDWLFSDQLVESAELF